MKYGEWVETVWQCICAEAETGPTGKQWSALVSDGFLDTLGVINPHFLAEDEQQALLSAVGQAASLLQDKALYIIDGAKVALTERGLKYRSLSPLYLWPELELSQEAGQFLSEAARRLSVEGPRGLYILRRPPGVIAVKELFNEFGWEYSDPLWKELKSELYRPFLIEPVRSTPEVLVRITEHGMLYASYID